MLTYGHFDEAFEKQIVALFDAACAKLVEANLLPESLVAVRVVVNPRMRSVAGWAKYATNTIELNYRLLSVDPVRLEKTFNHEIAHMVAVEKFGKAGRGHGRGWAKVMSVLGYAPNRCHNYDVTELKHERRKFAYVCPCGKSFAVGIVRHRKITAGTRYRCKACAGVLTAKP